MRFAALICCLLIAACAPTKENTYGAHTADIVSTGVGLTMGAVELNPLWPLALVAKVYFAEHADTLPMGEQESLHATVQSVTWGVVGNNVCVILSIATAGSFGPLCPVIGIVTGFTYWDKVKYLIPRPVPCFPPGSEQANELPDFVCKSEDASRQSGVDPV